MTFNTQYIAERKWKLTAAALVLYIIYKVITGNFGPVPVRINVNSSEIENIVVKIRIKGMQAPLKPGHAMTTRYTLHEEVLLVNGNELTEFPRAYMWMALDPVEYSIAVYHPAIKTEYWTVKSAELENENIIPITEINVSLFSNLIDSAKQEYDDVTLTEKMKYIIRNNVKNSYSRYHLIHTRDHYIPALKNAKKNSDEIYQQLKQMIVDCEKLFTVFDYGKECGMDETFLRVNLDLIDPGNQR